MPLSIIILGFVLYSVWARQNESDTRNLAPSPEAPMEAAPPVAAAPEAAAPVEVAPEETPAAATPTETEDAEPPAASKREPSAETAATAVSEAVEPEKPAAPAEVVAVPSTGSDDLSAKLEAFCLACLHGTEERTKDDLAVSVDRFIRSSDPEPWKAAPVGDLEMLLRTLAVAALFGPGNSKYRSGLEAPPDYVAGEVSADLQEKTKKALHTFCVETLRDDLRALSEQDDYPSALSRETVQEAVDALHGEDALAGLSRCSKDVLARLTTFLGRA